MILPEALPANQMECRETCSDGVYHMPVMRLNPGEMALSSAPRKKRTVIMPAKLDTTACKVSTIPHRKLPSISPQLQARVDGAVHQSTEILAKWELDKAHTNRVRSDEIAGVEDAGRPTELLLLEMLNQ
jgi:hypothetical protein